MSASTLVALCFLSSMAALSAYVLVYGWYWKRRALNGAKKLERIACPLCRGTRNIPHGGYHKVTCPSCFGTGLRP